MVSTKNGGHHCGYSKLRSAVGAGRTLTEQALHAMGGLYEIERQARDMSDEERWLLALMEN